MTSCIVSAVFAGCLLLLFWSPPYLHELHKQPTYLTHVLNFSQGKYWKLTAAKTTPFLDLLSDEDKKGTEEGGLYRIECYAFSHHQFLLTLELALSSPVIFLPSSFQGINNFVNCIQRRQKIKMNWKRLFHQHFTARNSNLSQRFQQGSNLQALHVHLWHCKVINLVQHRSSY